MEKVRPWCVANPRIDDGWRTEQKLCYREILVPSKLRELHSGMLSQTPDLGKFRRGKSMVLSTKLVNGRACWPHLRRSTRRGWTYIVYYRSVDRNAQTPLVPVVLDLLYNLFLQLCSSWQDFDWHSASRGPSATAELLVLFSFLSLTSANRHSTFHHVSFFTYNVSTLNKALFWLNFIIIFATLS